MGNTQETLPKVRICILCGGTVERPSSDRGGWLRKYCNSCAATAASNNMSICVHPSHPGPRMISVDAFYTRHNSNKPMSYCKMCVGVPKPKEK